MEDSENSSDDSDAEQWENLNVKAGSMELVRQTLQGLASRNTEEGLKAMGRHARNLAEVCGKALRSKRMSRGS